MFAVEVVCSIVLIEEDSLVVSVITLLAVSNSNNFLRVD
jgi:hypothetical protein